MTLSPGHFKRSPVLAAGYGDGIPRALSNRGEVLIRRCGAAPSWDA